MAVLVFLKWIKPPKPPTGGVMGRLSVGHIIQLQKNVNITVTSDVVFSSKYIGIYCTPRTPGQNVSTRRSGPRPEPRRRYFLGRDRVETRPQTHSNETETRPRRGALCPRRDRDVSRAYVLRRSRDRDHIPGKGQVKHWAMWEIMDEWNGECWEVWSGDEELDGL